MSIRHMADVWADPYFGQGDKVKLLVALSIADCARSEDGKAWPSLDSIARKSRTSIRGAQEAIREMQKDGKIEVHEGKGVHGTNVYLLLSPPHIVHPAQRSPRKPAAEKAPEFPPEKAALDCTQSVRNGKEREGTGIIPPPPSPEVSPPKGVVEGKTSDKLPTSEQSKRVAKIFHRRLETPWSPKEIAAYKLIGTVPEQDLLAVERHYADNWPPKTGVNFLRHDLLTFLHNFNGEVDRAKNAATPSDSMFLSR